jgi:molybdopterin synthase sulfur carrier subunit
MTITVKFIGAFRHFSSAGHFELGFCGLTSISDLVNELVRKVPEIEHSLVDQQLGNPGPNALILVNGREIGVLDGLETRLKDGDEVVLVPVVHGG